MDRKFFRHIGGMVLLVCSLAVISPVTAFAGWQKEGDTYAYYEDDGTRVVNAFRKSGNQWFYLDEDGHLLRTASGRSTVRYMFLMREVLLFHRLQKSQAGAKKAQILIFPPSAADSSI